MKSHTTTCLGCGHAVDVRIEELHLKAGQNPARHILLQCPACGWVSNKALAALVFSLPEVQRFWRDHPRIRTLPMQEVDVDGSAAFVRRLQSVQDNAEITVIARQDSFDPIAIHTNVSV